MCLQLRRSSNPPSPCCTMRWMLWWSKSWKRLRRVRRQKSTSVLKAKDVHIESHWMISNWNWQCWWIMFRQFQIEVVEHVRDCSWCGHIFFGFGCAVCLGGFDVCPACVVVVVVLVVFVVDVVVNLDLPWDYCHYKPPSSWTLEGRVNLSLLLLSSFLALFGICALLFPGYSPDGNEDDDPPSDEPCLAKHPEVPKGLARSHLAHCFSNFK